MHVVKEKTIWTVHCYATSHLNIVIQDDKVAGQNGIARVTNATYCFAEFGGLSYFTESLSSQQIVWKVDVHVICDCRSFDVEHKELTISTTSKQLD